MDHNHIDYKLDFTVPLRKFLNKVKFSFVKINTFDDKGIEIPNVLYNKPKNMLKYANSKTND